MKLSTMKTVAKALRNGIILAISLLVWVGGVLLFGPIAMAQTPSPAPGLVKTTPSPAVPQAGSAVTPAPAKPDTNATTRNNTTSRANSTADSKKADAGGPYDTKAIEESYKSLYGS
jgi:hypothetical protein